jgi:hypothetical protein
MGQRFSSITEGSRLGNGNVSIAVAQSIAGKNLVAGVSAFGKT